MRITDDVKIMKTQAIRHRTNVDRYFLDTEFYENGSTIDLISIGIVAKEYRGGRERGGRREYYAVNANANFGVVSPWVRDNVLPSLPPQGDEAWKTKAHIASDLTSFVSYMSGADVEFWAYYADYDWVALCQCFGTMMDLPKHFPRFCMDLKQFSVMLGSPTHPKQVTGEHSALADARWNLDLYHFLRDEK